MKSLQEIINRNDYVNMNAALIKRAVEVAEIICNKMEELDFEKNESFRFGDKDNGIRLSLTTFRDIYSDCSVTHLCICHRVYDEDGIHYDYYAIDTECSYRLNCGTGPFIQRASYCEFCKILNMANTILQELDEHETKLVEKGKKALENSAGIAK